MKRESKDNLPNSVASSQNLNENTTTQTVSEGGRGEEYVDIKDVEAMLGETPEESVGVAKEEDVDIVGPKSPSVDFTAAPHRADRGEVDHGSKKRETVSQTRYGKDIDIERCGDGRFCEIKMKDGGKMPPELEGKWSRYDLAKQAVLSYRKSLGKDSL